MDKFIKILIISLISLGVIYNITLVFSFDKKYPEEGEIDCIAQVVSYKTEKERSSSYTVKVVSSNMPNTKNTKIIVYTSKNTDLEYGDIVQITGDFSKAAVARNYKGFNYRNYLKQSKIYGSVYVKTPKVVGHKTGILEKIFQLKMKLFTVLENTYEEQATAFLKGILLRR